MCKIDRGNLKKELSKYLIDDRIIAITLQLIWENGGKWKEK